MIGAGVFAAIGPAADAAGGGLLIGLAVAAGVAYCNATSSAQLAALYPASGGTYVYGRERLGHLWGFLAGWGFVIGKTASCAAMALTFGTYASPDLARPLGVGAVVALTAVNLLGVQKTAWLTRAIVAVVLGSLATVVIAGVHRRPDDGQHRAAHRGRVRRDPPGRRPALLRVRRLRPHRHARRGGPRPGPHDPPGHPAGARDHPRRLRRHRARQRSWRSDPTPSPPRPPR